MKTNSNQSFQDLYIENWKLLLREIKDLNRETYCVSGLEDSTFPTCKFSPHLSTNSTQFQLMSLKRFVVGVDNLILKFI